MRKSIMVLVVLVSLNQSTFAQSIWTELADHSAVRVEFLRPQFDNDRSNDFGNFAAFLGARVRLGESVFLVAELPFAHERLTIHVFDPRQNKVINLGPQSETVVGSPYLGLVAFKQGSPVVWEIGARIPRPEESEVGSSVDFDRFEAFYPDLWSFQIKLNRLSQNDNNLMTRFRIGPTVLGSTEGGDPQVFFDYGLQLGYDSDRFALIGGIGGRLWLNQAFSGGGENLDRLTSHQLGADARLKLGALQPGVHAKVLIDDNLARLIDVADDLNFVAGVNLQVAFR